MLKPTQNDLLVQILPEIVKKGEEKKATDMFTAEVLVGGPEVKAIKKGDTVVFAPFGIANVVVEGKQLIVVNEDMIKLYDRKKAN
jgi:co-chaperonin GroES (HSP10)